MAMAVLSINVSAKTKARKKTKAQTTQVTPAKKKLKITNAIELVLPTPNNEEDFEFITPPHANKENDVITKITDMTIVEDDSGTDSYSDVDEEEEFDDSDSDESYDKDDNNISEEEIEEIEDFYKYADDIKTIILDTERDASGNAVRRHLYLYEGKEDELSENGKQVISANKIKRISFPTDDAGLALWRNELVRLMASKNKHTIALIEAYKKEWEKGELSDSTYYRIVYDDIREQQREANVHRPIVSIKPLDNVESGDVVDALIAMNISRITTFSLFDITHADSVMVFNSLYPGKDMPSGVNFYTYGNINEHPQKFDFVTDVPDGYNEINPEDFRSDLRFDPILTIEVEASKQNDGGALVSLILDENLYKEVALKKCYNKKQKREVKRFLVSQAFKRIVNSYGNNVAQPKKIEVEPVDLKNETYKKNKFQQPIYDLVAHSRYWWRQYNGLGVYIDRHTPFSALKCVFDNLLQMNINSMILAY